MQFSYNNFALSDTVSNIVLMIISTWDNLPLNRHTCGLYKLIRTAAQLDLCVELPIKL